MKFITVTVNGERVGMRVDRIAGLIESSNGRVIIISVDGKDLRVDQSFDEVEKLIKDATTFLMPGGVYVTND